MVAATVAMSLIAVAGAGVLVTWAASNARAELPHGSTPDGSIYRDGKFHNGIETGDVMARGGMFKTMRDFLFDNRAVRVPTAPLPVQTRRAAEFTRHPAGGVRITWLGHSTMLIEIDGKRFLTDPIWTERASPVGFTGPRRFFAPPLALEELPYLDAVVISHDHYDHLDADTIKLLSATVPLFLVPLGVGAHLLDWSVPAERIRELDWWQETLVGDHRLVCTPARHFSGRGVLDRNRTLWASWAIIGPTHRAYFSGDGGMAPLFAEIGRRLGPFDVTMMEVGAYHTNWSDIHNGPEQAVQAHRDLRGGVMVPIHWGTFNLSLHGWTEPAERLLVAARAKGVKLAIPRPGASVTPPGVPEVERWWPDQPWQSAEEMPVVSPGLEQVVSSLP